MFSVSSTVTTLGRFSCVIVVQYPVPLKPLGDVLTNMRGMRNVGAWCTVQKTSSIRVDFILELYKDLKKFQVEEVSDE